MTDKIVILCNCASADEAASIARHLVEKRLAACVNILPAVRSIYHWQGAIEDGSECTLVIKTRRPLFDSIRAEVQRTHSYTVPELIALPVVDGLASYLDWIDRETTLPDE